MSAAIDGIKIAEAMALSMNQTDWSVTMHKAPHFGLH
jgi:hypothetical protein